MVRFVRRSLLGQLLGVYLVFVAVVLLAGLTVRTILQQLDSDVRAADRALARAIALETDTKLRNARSSLIDLAQLQVLHTNDPQGMEAAFRAFKAARPDIDRVYWINPNGIMGVSVPASVRTSGTDYAEERIFQHASVSSEPVVEAGAVDLTTYNAVAIVAQPIRANDGHLLGIVATNLSLDDMCVPLRTIVEEQQRQGGRLDISLVDGRGQLIATPERERLLQRVLDELPGASDALIGIPTTGIGPGRHGSEWLFSAAPVPSVGWAVVVQRPTADALAVANSFNTWLSGAALLFGIGGLLFWLALMRQVIRPLHALATRHQGLPSFGATLPAYVSALPTRADEVGILARSLQRLEDEVTTRLSELNTLLETSNAVVGTLDPQAVAQTIIREVQRLVNVQAASVFVPNDNGILRVLASAGHRPDYDRIVNIAADSTTSPSAAALRDGRPVQIIAGEGVEFPPISYSEGFRALLAIPIISRHVGGVVLLVYRTQAQAFTANEVDLLLTFANYATLAWEHAVLYERSDERLREIARENERLYRQAAQEKQTLAAIMGSMSDGLVLTSIEGRVLYANPGAYALAGMPPDAIEGRHIDAFLAPLRAKAARPDEYDHNLAHAAAGRMQSWLLESNPELQHQTISLRMFDVHDDNGQPIGRGLLLRDVTHEREIDQFKTTLLAAVGHELRTPLSAIKGHASTLLQEDVVWPLAEQRHFLQTISDEADRLAQLVGNLLDMSRIEAGLLPLERAPWPIDALVTRAAQRLGQPIAGLKQHIPSDLPLIEVDGPRIEVVLRNLLANARAYGEGGVRVTAACDGDQMIVSVADDGPGIAPDELPQIFERFYRARRGLRQRSGGTGLGLAICKAFVEAHGGQIWVESHEGTTFSFTLPLAPVAAAR
jgi:signal transduction histidine kinase